MIEYRGSREGVVVMKCPGCGKKDCIKVGHLHRQVLTQRFEAVVRSVFAYQTYYCESCPNAFDKADPHYVPWKR